MSHVDTEDLIELNYDLAQNSVCFELDEQVYPRDGICSAAYMFIDRCFVFLTHPREGCIAVQLKTKEPNPAREVLGALAGEFANELLNQLVRAQVAASTTKLREYTMARAFFAPAANPTVEELLAELDDEEDDEDLEIRVPWQEKKAAADE